MNCDQEKEYESFNATHSENPTQHRNKSKSPKKATKKLKPNLEQKTLICEITRLKGQEKLLYVKQLKYKKIEDNLFFEEYPFSKFDSFTFDIEALTSYGKIFRDDNGLHWLEQNAQPQDQKSTKMNGWAISIFNDGKIFEGVYHNSHPCGMCYELQPNGNTYIGNFKEGVKSGSGTYYWFNNNEMYNGEWLGNLPHGHGKYLSKDYYEGQFSNGLKYGTGEEYFENGDIYIGEYINGVADGYGEYFWSDGSVYKGDFKHGVRHGYGIWSDKEETEIYYGCYRMDKKEGFGVYEWVGKQIYKGQFKEDFREGFGRLNELSSKFAENLGNSRVYDERVVYQGTWFRGKQKADGPIDKEAMKKLDIFIKEYGLDADKKRKKVGHQNCIPK